MPTCVCCMLWCAVVAHLFHIASTTHAPFPDPQPPTPHPTPGKFRNAGQTCVSPNRLLVQAGIHDRFVARLTEKVRPWALWRAEWVWMWGGWGVGSFLVSWGVGVGVGLVVLFVRTRLSVCSSRSYRGAVWSGWLATNERSAPAPHTHIDRLISSAFHSTHSTHAPILATHTIPPKTPNQQKGVGAAGGPRAPAGGAAGPADQRGGPAKGAASRGGRRQEGA